MVFSMRMARKYASLSCGPVAHLEVPGRSRAAAAAREFRCLQHIVELEADSGGTIADPAAPRHPQIDQRQDAVVLLQTDLENADDLEFLQPRHDHVAAAGGAVPGNHHGHADRRRPTCS